MVGDALGIAEASHGGEEGAEDKKFHGIAEEQVLERRAAITSGDILTTGQYTASGKAGFNPCDTGAPNPNLILNAGFVPTRLG